MAAGKTDDEIAALKKAIKIRPSYASARYNLAIVSLKKGDKKAAMREYEALKAFDEGVAAQLMKEIEKAGYGFSSSPDILGCALQNAYQGGGLAGMPATLVP